MIKVENKKCYRCKNFKEVSFFHKDKQNKSGYKSYCKSCLSKKHNEINNLDDETWKPIIGYENYYEVSDKGRVKSLNRYVNQIYGARIVKSKILSPSLNKKNGYFFVNLSLLGKIKAHLIHRLVAIAFIPNPEKKSEVNHVKNEEGVVDKQDNRSCVLEWNTSEENKKNAVIDGLILKGEQKHLSKLSEKDVFEIRDSTLTQKELSVKYKVSHGLISRVKKRLCWKHI